MPESASSGTRTEPQRLLDVTDAARILSVGRTTLHHLIAVGELASVKVGRRRLIPSEAIDVYIDRLRAAEPSGTPAA